MKTKIFILVMLISGMVHPEILKVAKAGTKQVEFFGQKITVISQEQYQAHYKVGQRVLAKYPGVAIPVLGALKDAAFGKDKYWYLGTITKTDFSAKKCNLFIIYDDGDKSWAPCYFAIPFQPFSGMNRAERDSFLAKPVLARFYDSGRNLKYWYRATVTRLDNGKYFIVYDDGDTKVHADMNTVAQGTFWIE